MSTLVLIFTCPNNNKIVLNDVNVSRIISVVDSDENKWHEVDYLSQDLVPVEILNDEYAIREHKKIKSTLNRFITIYKGFHNLSLCKQA